MQNRNQSDDQTIEQQRKLVAARRKHVGELASKVRSARRQNRLDCVRDERRELLSAAKEYFWQKQKLDGMMPSDEQAEYAGAFDMWGQVEEIDTKVAELKSKPALDVAAVLACDDAISKLHEKRAHLLQMESPETEPVAQAEPIPTSATDAQAQPVQASESESLDYSMLADPDELIEAFGRNTDMSKAWFSNLKDKPGLERTRRVAGMKGKGGYKPLFCPLEVMLWLTNEKRKVGRPISVEKGWLLLESYFPKVYAAHAVADPR